MKEVLYLAQCWLRAGAEKQELDFWRNNCPTSPSKNHDTLRLKEAVKSEAMTSAVMSAPGVLNFGGQGSHWEVLWKGAMC